MFNNIFDRQLMLIVTRHDQDADLLDLLVLGAGLMMCIISLGHPSELMTSMTFLLSLLYLICVRKRISFSFLRPGLQVSSNMD